MKTLTELREMRNTKAARLQELVELFKTDGHEASDEETGEFDSLAAEVKTLDQDIRIAGFHATQAQAAKAVDGSSAQRASASRGGMSFVKTQDPDDAFEGQSFTRRVIAKALGQMLQESASRIAEARWGKSHPKLVQWIKADVAGGGSGSGEWGAELVSADNRFTGDFIKYLYSVTLFDSLPLRPVPANVTIKGQDGASTASWVGESKAIPVTTMDTSTVSLTPLKVAAIAVMSNELIRDSSPGSEMLLRDSLVESSAQKVDTTFFSTAAASAGVSPAGILNGVTIGATGGATEAELIGDMVGLTRPFITAKYNLADLIWVTNPLIAMQIGLMRNALGQNAFGEMGPSGGKLDGRRAYAGHNVSTGDFILLSPSDIWKIGDGGVEVTLSREATIEMNDGPTGASDSPADMSAKRVSMFQSESTAFKVVRSINWAKRRSGAVQYIGNASYGDINSV